MKTAHRLVACTPMRRVAQAATMAIAFAVSPSMAAAAEECEPLLEDESLKDLYDRCLLILDLETFSRFWVKNQGWQEARDYSTTAIHAVDYLTKKIAGAQTQAPLIQQMSQKRAELEKRKGDCEAQLTKKKEVDERRDKVLVNLRIPAGAPDVYVNGSQVTGPVYVPAGKIAFGVGQDGGRYDRGTLSVTGKKLEVQVAKAERVDEADPAAKASRSPALDLSVGPIFGGRYLPWSVYKGVDGMAGLRSEVTLPDLVQSEVVRLRPVARYTFEQGPLATNWKAHSFGFGLKLTVVQFLDLALTGGVARIDHPESGNLWSTGGYGPELSAGVFHTIVNGASKNGPKLGIGAGVAAGFSYWRDPGAPDSNTSLAVAPYINAGVFLRVRFGRSLPPREPLASDMVHFKGGPVGIGWDSGDRSEKPEHVVLLGSFDLDVREVTVAEYRVCADAGKCTQPESTPGCNWNVSGRRNHPINCVTREQASTYCGFMGKRLPTESEWEYAARGSLGRKYPWGDQPPTFQPCWAGSDRSVKTTCEVASHPGDMTPDGVMDLGGNVSEWTGQYCDYLKASCDNAGWVCRGGSYGHENPEALRSSARYVPKQAAIETVGFRCAR